MAAKFALILETSTQLGSAAVADMHANQVVAQCHFESDRNHNADMFGPLGKMLAPLNRACFKRIIVGSGPGSYSGTRVAIAVAQGMAIVHHCPVVAIPSWIAIDFPAVSSLAIGDARRGHWWWARLCNRTMESSTPEMGDVDALQNAVADAIASGREIYTFEDPCNLPFDYQINRKFPTASALWSAWLEADEITQNAWENQPAQPCYLKPPHITAPMRPWLQHLPMNQKGIP